MFELFQIAGNVFTSLRKPELGVNMSFILSVKANIDQLQSQPQSSIFLVVFPTIAKLDGYSSNFCKVRNRWCINQGIIHLHWSSFKEGEPSIRWFILEPEKRGLSAGVIADLRSSAHEIIECNQILLFI